MIILKEPIPNDQHKYLKVEDYKFKRVHGFKYLGSLFAQMLHGIKAR